MLKNDAQQVPKQDTAKRDGVKTQKITISISFSTDNFDFLKTLLIKRHDRGIFCLRLSQNMVDPCLCFDKQFQQPY